MQISCRDRNRIAIQGDILGGAAMGVCNVLCLSGDGVQAGDHPEAKPVFDLDAVTLLETARTLRDEHRFLSGRKISFAPRVFLGAAENPSAEPLAFRAQRVAKKVAAGAQFIRTPSSSAWQRPVGTPNAKGEPCAWNSCRSCAASAGSPGRTSWSTVRNRRSEKLSSVPVCSPGDNPGTRDVTKPNQTQGLPHDANGD